MSQTILKILISSSIIAFVSWLSGKKTSLAGFLTALPLISMLALAFSYTDYKDSYKSVEYAKSIFYAIPLSLTFFIPFLFSEKLNIGFWTCYILGFIFLSCGFFIHQNFLK